MSTQTATKSASKSTPKSAPLWESPEWQEAVRQNPGLKPFFDNLESFVELPEGVEKLRLLLLDVAVRGKLVDQEEADEPAANAVEQIAELKAKLLEEKSIQKDKKFASTIKENPPWDVPSQWAWVRFQDVFEVVRGGSPRPAGDPRFFGGDIPWITVREITKDTNLYLTETRDTITELGSEKSRFVHPDDLLLTNSGATLGVPKINKITGCINDGVAFLNAFHVFIDKPFAYYFLTQQTRAFRAVNQGMGQPNLNTPILAGWWFPLPPLAEQRRIVSKVEGLMSLCDTLESHRRARESVRERASRSVLASLTSAPRTASTGERPKAAPKRQASGVETLASAWQRLSDHFEVLLDQPSGPAHLRQSILQLAVQGKLVPLTDEDVELLGRDTRVGDYLSMQNGYAFKSTWFEPDGIRLVRNANIGHGNLDWSDVAKISEERAEEYERFRMVEGDIVLTLDRPLITTGLKVARVTKDDLPSLLLQRVARPVFKDGCNLRPDYFYTWLQSPFFIDSIDPGKSNGVPHISTREVQKINFAPPTQASQKRIVSKVSVLLSQLDELSARLRSRQSTTDALLTALIHQILNGVGGHE